MIPVLFVCPNMAIGGAERHWAQLLPAFAEHGIQPSLLTLDGTGPFFDHLRQAGIEVSCARLRNRCDLPRLAACIRTSAATRPRVIVSRAPSALVVGQLIARRCGARHLYNEHRQIGRPFDARVTRMMSLVAPRTNGVIAISEMQRSDLEALGFTGQSIHTVPNGVPIRERDPKAIAALRPQLGPDDDFCAVLVATLRPEKDVETFIRALVAAAADGVTGAIVGDGPERTRLEALASELGAPVRFLGSRSDAIEVMAAAQVVCLSSRMEGVPMALLEAMSVGRPVVATDVGAVGEIVEHERTGLLVSPDDANSFAGALRRLAIDSSLCHAYGVEAQRRQRSRYSSMSMMDEYARILLASARTSTNRLAARPIDKVRGLPFI